LHSKSLHQTARDASSQELHTLLEAAMIAALIDFLSLAAWISGLCFFCYGTPTALLRAIEFVVGARVAAVKPRLLRYAGMQFLATLGQAVFTPALCYVAAGLVYKGGQFTDPNAFSTSAYFWASAWIVGILLPVQFHYSLNRRIYSSDPEQTVVPAWLSWYWGANSVLAATLMWVPLWTSWLTLEPMW
jgi:hypothetical protein